MPGLGHHRQLVTHSSFSSTHFRRVFKHLPLHPTRSTLLVEVEGSTGEDVTDDGVKIQSRSIEKVRTIL